MSITTFYGVNSGASWSKIEGNFNITEPGNYYIGSISSQISISIDEQSIEIGDQITIADPNAQISQINNVILGDNTYSFTDSQGAQALNTSFEFVSDRSNFIFIKSDNKEYRVLPLSFLGNQLNSNNIVNSKTGYHRISLNKPVSPINTSTAATGTNIITGHDLTQASDMILKFTFVDQNNQTNPWQTQEIDVDQMLIAYNSGSAVDAYVHIFDNDWIRINVVDPATGELNFVDQGRDMAYVKSELWVTATNTDPLFEINNIGTFVTTANFQNLGDPNTKIQGFDGDTVFIEYGDLTRDRFTFFDGIARGDRRVGGTTNSELEFRVNPLGQMQVKHNNNASGIRKSWYKEHRY